MKEIFKNPIDHVVQKMADLWQRTTVGYTPAEVSDVQNGRISASVGRRALSDKIQTAGLGAAAKVTELDYTGTTRLIAMGNAEKLEKKRL
jgi:hypothetical protein